ncbi:phytoene desaturase family protein [Halobacterium zhouii]|uniref:phytoene desaturase family protein n=1 Tax=Halobacterium zhouii TaxID=2902624 RepID=UPI001E2E6D57|nr:NAD(P)/FAD-dependent oxidoreductase [Halobacterium zhouii]
MEPSRDRYDAVIVGAGHNGLTAALVLASEGWTPLVVERNEKIGGALRSDELTEDGYVHDTFSTNQNLFLDSAVFEEFGDRLREHGLAFSTSAKPFANVFPDGDALRVYQDAERTREELAAHSAADAAGWETLRGEFDRFERTFLPLYGTELPSVEAGRQLASALRSEGVRGLTELAQIPLSSTRELGDAYFETPEAKALMACWGMHIDFGPEVSGGGMFPFLESFGALEHGISVTTGGASHLVEALADVLREEGGEVVTGTEVTSVLTADDRAVGVRLDSGETVHADRAVVGNVTPTVLFENLLEHHDFSDSFESKVDRYEYGPGTMMVHLALDDLPDWDAAADLDEFAYVHIAPYVEDLSATYRDARNGYIPESPMLVVGQTTAVDDSRTPDDGDILWVQVRALPSEIRGDAAGDIDATDWDEAKDPVADRVIGKLSEYAPEIRELIRDRTVLSPADLEAENPNLVGGDSVAGSHHLRQNFLWRPFPGWSRYEMPLDGLYMCGAATWPGAGNNAASGYLAAKHVLRPSAPARLANATEEYAGLARTWLRRNF